MPIVCPGLRAPHIPPFSKSARCLSREAAWGQAPAAGRGGWSSAGLTLVEDAKCGCHSEAGVPLAAGTKAPCLRCVSSCLCLQLEGWELSFECL